MPEGPEIHRAAARLERALLNQTVSVECCPPRLQAAQALIDGQQVNSVRARSKAMLIGFANGYTLYSHNQLYGVWYVRPSGSWPATRRQLRVRLDTGRKMALLYSASEIQLLDADGLANHPYLSRLGPDVLASDVEVAQVLARYRDPRFGGRRIASLLLDQGFLAGIGNYLRSEIMHVAGIPPEARPRDLSEARLQALADASLALPRRSLASAGVVNQPERVAALKAAGLSRRTYRFAAFTRNGQPCYGCGEPIARREVGGRRLYFCPGCQA